jgi:HSP20 family protein
MFGDFRDFDRTYLAFDQLRARLDRAFDELAFEAKTEASGGAVPVNFFDKGDRFVVEAEVPGLEEKDIDVLVHQNVLTLRAKRAAVVPEGYSVHRKERSALEFTRSFTLPAKIDADTVTATLSGGLLTLDLRKAKDAQPRQISVRSS